MNTHKFQVEQDLQIIREIAGFSQQDLADALHVFVSTIEQWEKQEKQISENNRDMIYAYAYKKNIEINKIKEQLYLEEHTHTHQTVLFHGAKSIIEGALNLSKSRINNDFGKGFYCGETLEQSALFISSFPTASIYILKFDYTDLQSLKFQVNQEWMLTIAYYRGKLKQYQNHPKIKKLIARIDAADYIIAPIADNRMFQIIDSFINGEITDEQCKHCLAATNLGFQYVFKTTRALQRIEILERCYLCSAEKEMYLNKKSDDTKISEDKIKIARKNYRGKGHYIDEILL